jgi:hypothetical protein
LIKKGLCKYVANNEILVRLINRLRFDNDREKKKKEKQKEEDEEEEQQQNEHDRVYEESPLF